MAANPYRYLIGARGVVAELLTSQFDHTNDVFMTSRALLLGSGI